MLREVFNINHSDCVSKKKIRMTRLKAGRPVRRLFFNVIDEECLGIEIGDWWMVWRYRFENCPQWKIHRAC